MEKDPNEKETNKNESRGKRLFKKAIRRNSKSSNDSQNSAVVGVSKAKSSENNDSIGINDSAPLPKPDGTKESIEKVGKTKKDGKTARLSQKASSRIDKVGKTIDRQENRNKIFSESPSPSKKSSKLIPTPKIVIKGLIAEEDGVKKNLKRKLDEETGAGTSGASTSADPDADDSNKVKKKKNRCGVCGKKVGLTGFECRCGGLFCAVHRYSDKHDCTFDYKELGAQEIRRNNPVVVSQKIDKI